jgi:hypothetical protein
MAKIYTKATWTDEVLAGDQRFDILDDDGVPIYEDVQINLSTGITTVGSTVDAAKMQNLEDGVDALDSEINDTGIDILRLLAATELTLATDAITVTQGTHKLQPQTGTTDELKTISGLAVGQVVILYMSDPGTDTLTIKHGTGNISCSGGADITFSQGALICYSNGTTVFVSGGGGGALTYATAAEINAGTEAAKVIAPDQLAIAGRFWKTMLGTPVRTGNTTFTVTGDYTTKIAKGLIIKWAEGGVTKFGMVSIPSTYGAPNTTVTIIGDTMTSIDAGSLKYGIVGAEAFAWKFARAGNIGAVEADFCNARYAEEPMKVLGADLQVGTAGTTNSTTVDINKNGATMFTTKPTLATTVASSPTPFTADNGSVLALGDKITLDADAIQTTNAIDFYGTLYVLPSRYEFLT